MQGVCEKIWGGRYAGEGKEDKMRGECCEKKIEGGMPERGKEDKMGGCEKNWGGGGVCRRG